MSERSPMMTTTTAPEIEPIPIISINFTSEDVLLMAEELGVPYEVALDRALDWGKHIEQTMSGYCAEQLESVIKTNQP